MRWPTRRLYGVVNGFSSPVGKGARTGNLEGIRFVSLCLAGWWNAIRLQGNLRLLPGPLKDRMLSEYH